MPQCSKDNLSGLFKTETFAIGINTNCKAISTKKNFQEVQKRPKRVEVSFIII